MYNRWTRVVIRVGLPTSTDLLVLQYVEFHVHRHPSILKIRTPVVPPCEWQIAASSFERGDSRLFGGHCYCYCIIITTLERERETVLECWDAPVPLLCVALFTTTTTSWQVYQMHTQGDTFPFEQNVDCSFSVVGSFFRFFFQKFASLAATIFVWHGQHWDFIRRAHGLYRENSKDIHAPDYVRPARKDRPLSLSSIRVPYKMTCGNGQYGLYRPSLVTACIAIYQNMSGETLENQPLNVSGDKSNAYQFYLFMYFYFFIPPEKWRSLRWRKRLPGNRRCPRFPSFYLLNCVSLRFTDWYVDWSVYTLPGEEEMIAGRGSLSGNADRWQSTNDINPVDIWNRFRIGCLVTFDDYSINLCISFLEISSLPTTSLNTIGKLEKKTSPPYTNSNEIRPIKQMIQPERNIRRAKERDKVGWGQRMGKIIKNTCV